MPDPGRRTAASCITADVLLQLPDPTEVAEPVLIQKYVDSMFSLAELQNNKALLKRNAAETAPACAEPTIILGTRDSSAILLDSSDIKTNIPQPTISLQTLASARVGLHKIPSVSSTAFKSIPPAIARTDDHDDVALPAFARRKELFEKHNSHTTKSVDEMLPFCVTVIDHLKQLIPNHRCGTCR